MRGAEATRTTVERRYQYRGDLAERALAEMLYAIYHYRVPGVIQAIRDDVVKRVYLKDGYVIHATSSDIQDSLGCYLLSAGMISRHDFKTTMRERRTSESRYGTMLVERGLLSPAELYHAIRLQTEEVVWSLFNWEEGQITFSIGEFQPSTVPIQIPMRQVIKEGVKRVPNAKRLLARVGTKETVLEASYEMDDLIEVALHGQEFELLRLVDGKRTLLQLCADGQFSSAENGRLLYAFLVLQFVKPLKQQVPAPPPVSEPGAVRFRFKTGGDRRGG